MTIEELKNLNDEQLIAGTARLITLQNQCITRQVVFIMEIDRRRLHWRAGHANLATFLVEKFALTEDQAYKRIRVARAVAFYPQLLEPLRRKGNHPDQPVAGGATAHRCSLRGGA